MSGARYCSRAPRERPSGQEPLTMNRGYIFIFLATVFFSSMEVALKTVASDFNPMQLTCTRFLIGGLLLIPFALRGLRQHGATVTLAAWKGFAGLGFVGLVVSMMLYQVSILYAPASVVSVLFSCNPVLVLGFAYLILRADIRPQHITALVLEVVAAVIIIDPLHTSADPVGIVLVLLSAATFALYAVLGKKQCAQYSGVAVTCFSCLAASAEMIALMLISHIGPVADALQAAGAPMFANMALLLGLHFPQHSELPLHLRVRHRRRLRLLLHGHGSHFRHAGFARVLLQARAGPHPRHDRARRKNSGKHVVRHCAHACGLGHFHDSHLGTLR